MSESHNQILQTEYCGTCSLNNSDVKGIAQGLLLFLGDALNEGFGYQKFEARCQELGLSEKSVFAICKLWKKRSVQIASSLLSRSITNNRLVDLDWNFGVTSATNDCDHIGKTYLQLKLTLSGGAGTQVVLMELTLDQFYQFLASMEKCKSYLDFVSPVNS